MAVKINFNRKFLFYIEINLAIYATNRTAHIPAVSPYYVATGHMDA